MATRLENSKKILCCSAAAQYKFIETEIKAVVCDRFINAAQAFCEETEVLLNETVPFETNADKQKGVRLATAAVDDAMGRLALAELLPAQSFVDTLTDAQEEIANFE
jgi:hypothetical protein